MAAIFVTIVATQDTTVEFLHHVSGFSRDFVRRTLALIEQKSWLATVEFARLVIAVHAQRGEDLAELNRALDSVMLSFWEQSDHAQLELLGKLRGGLLFGGLSQWWADEENDPVPVGFLTSQWSEYGT